MSNCLITQNFERGCRDSSGGLKKILLANKEQIVSTSATTQTGLIDSVVMTSGATFYEYVPLKFGAEINEETTPVAENSGTIYKPQLTIRLGKFEAKKRNEILMLGQADTVAIVQMQTGEWAMAGVENGLHLESGTYQSGRNLDEANMFTIVLAGQETQPMFEVDEDIIQGLLA